MALRDGARRDGDAVAPGEERQHVDAVRLRVHADLVGREGMDVAIRVLSPRVDRAFVALGGEGLLGGDGDSKRIREWRDAGAALGAEAKARRRHHARDDGPRRDDVPADGDGAA